MLWIHASNPTRFNQSVRDVADLLEIVGREDPKANILLLLRNWLRKKSNGPWLVVLDNADNASFLLESPEIVAGGQGYDAVTVAGMFPAPSPPVCHGRYVPLKLLLTPSAAHFRI